MAPRDFGAGIHIILDGYLPGLLAERNIAPRHNGLDYLPTFFSHQEKIKYMIRECTFGES
jgi:hypothetical protein